MKIKYKFILFFTTLLIFMLILISIFNIKSFKDDKIAYVFSSLMESTDMSMSLLANEVQSQKTNFEIIISSFDFSSGRFPIESKSYLQANETVSFIEVRGEKDKKYIELDHIGSLENRNILPNIIPPEQSSIKKEGILNPFLLKNSTDKWGLSYTFKIEGQNYDSYQILILYNKNPIQVLLDKQRYFKLFLIDEVGNIISSPKSFRDSHLNSLIQEKVIQLISEKKKDPILGDLNSITKEIIPVNQEPMMVSISTLPGFSWSFLSVIEKEKTLEAVNKMKMNSIGVFIFLVGIGLLLTIFLVRSLIKNIEILSQSLILFSKGELKAKSEIKSKDEIGTLSNIFNDMTEKIEKLVADNVEKSRMAGELETARAVQKAMVPVDNFQEHDAEIIGYFEPASECGGDWWYYSVTDKTISLYIADVTGHGVASALLTSALRASVSALKLNSDLQLNEFVTNLNKVIYEAGRGKLMMTFFMCHIDRHNGKVEYINASHCPPVIFRKDNSETKNIDMIFLKEIGGPRLGEQEDSNYQSHLIDLKENDLIFTFTDGLTEFINEDKKMFGERRAFKKISKTLQDNLSAEEIKKQLMLDFEKYRNGRPLDDDLTLIFFRYIGASELFLHGESNLDEELDLIEDIKQIPESA